VCAALGLTALLFAAGPVAAQSDPATAVSGFLGIYGGFHPSDGIPQVGARAKLTPYLSPGLNKLLADSAAAEARFAAKVKDSPPLIEGDLFTSLFEGATSWRPGPCSITGAAARCPVAFTHADPKAKPETWTDTLLLVQTPQGWRVDDVAYDGNFQFGNTGKMTDTLKMVLSEAP
jgi:hypothetical protein